MSGRSRAQVARQRRRRLVVVVGGIVVAMVAILATVLAWSGESSTPSVDVALTEYAFSPTPINAPADRLAITTTAPSRTTSDPAARHLESDQRHPN